METDHQFACHWPASLFFSDLYKKSKHKHIWTMYISDGTGVFFLRQKNDMSTVDFLLLHKFLSINYWLHKLWLTCWSQESWREVRSNESIKVLSLRVVTQSTFIIFKSNWRMKGVKIVRDVALS